MQVDGVYWNRIQIAAHRAPAHLVQNPLLPAAPLGTLYTTPNSTSAQGAGQARARGAGHRKGDVPWMRIARKFGMH